MFPVPGVLINQKFIIKIYIERAMRERDAYLDEGGGKEGLEGVGELYVCFQFRGH